MADDVAQCTCGWWRPLIGLTTLDGQPPPRSVVPVYRCPCCGVSYVSTEISAERAAEILRSFDGPGRN